MTGALLVISAGIFFGALAYLLRPGVVIYPRSPLWWLRWGINPTPRTSLGYWHVDRSSGHVLPLPEWRGRRWPTVTHYTVRNGVGRIILEGTDVFLEQDGERYRLEVKPGPLERLNVHAMHITTRLYTAGEDGPEIFAPPSSEKP